MGWPGEQLLGKMWETLADKGVGGLLRPSQIKREALAKIAMERLKQLTDAQTERDSEDIKKGRKTLSDFSVEFNRNRASGHIEGMERLEPSVGYKLLVEVCSDRLISDAIRQEGNISKVIEYASEVLREDPSVPPEETVNDSWIFRWRDYAGEVSTDDLQKIWGNLLAGEIKAPGSYSLRCLDFVRSLSQEDALLIEKFSCLLCSEIIWNPKDRVYKLPVSFSETLDLQELGLISGAESLSLSMEFEDLGTETSHYEKILECHDKCLVVTHPNKSCVLEVDIFSVTKLGLQVMSLGVFKADVKYLEAMGKEIASIGYEVHIADLVIADDGRVFAANKIKLSN